MDAKGPTAKPEEVEDYLRNLGAKDWGASLDVAVLPRKRKPTKQREAANDREPAPKPQPPPKPKPPPANRQSRSPSRCSRSARPSPRRAGVTELMKLLDHEIDAKGVRKRMAALARQKLPQLVATLDKKVVGLCGVHAMVAIHRDQPVGRITILVVAEEARGRGIGRARRSRRKQQRSGCGLIEVTSNDRLAAATPSTGTWATSDQHPLLKKL